MDKDFLFSVVVPLTDRYHGFDECINSLINQNIGFEDKVQLIFLNADEKSKSDIYKESHPDNVFIINDRLSVSDIKGKYIHFICDYKKYSEKAFKSADAFFSQNPDVNIVKFGETTETMDLKAKFNVSLRDLSQVVFKRELLNDTVLNEILADGLDFYHMIRLIAEETRLGIVNANFHIYAMDHVSKEWLENRVNQYRKILDDFPDSRFIQHAIVYDLMVIMVNKQTNDIFDTPNDIVAKITDILNDIDDNIIKKHDNVKKAVKSFMLYLKRREFSYQIKKDKVFLKTGKYVINGLHGHSIALDIIDIKDGYLNLSGAFTSSSYPESLDFEAVVKKPDGSREIYRGLKNIYPTTERATVRYLGMEWIYNPCFDFEIPLENHENIKISFRVIFHENGDEKVLNVKRLNFKLYSNLSKYSNYLVKDKRIVLYRDEAIHVVDYSFIFRLKLELKSMKNIITSGERNAWYSIFIRLCYFALYLFWKNRRIWIFADRRLIADDNAKHLFKYALKQNDEVRKYYVLEKDSGDFADMKKISKNIVEYDSLRHKMLYLYAEKFISSHSGNVVTNPFHDDNQRLFSGLTSIERCFLQHGITIHDVSYVLRKYRQNFYLVVTASDKERQSMMHPNYNYKEGIIQTLGFPRYDNLSNDDLKKQILFMPTWRKSILSKEDLLNSSYFKRINDFFNNEKIMKLLDENGYKIMFKPHFELLEYCHLFDMPDTVVLSTEESYQELFNKSKILITDYSSVFFDFAYLKKPVIYYREDNEVFHYDEGYFDFESMGFGDLIYDEDELVRKIEGYLADDCRMEEKYIHRVDTFFKFTDKNNCKRVYDRLYEIK